MKRKTVEDQITLAGVKIYPFIGVTPEERLNAQECQADVTVWGNFEKAAATDSIDTAIDYCEILTKIQETARTGEYALVETLAYRIGGDILRSFPISRIRIKLRKRPEVLIGKLDYVEIEVEESKRPRKSISR